MVQLTLNETDEARLKVLLTALKRGKWELEGEEILAFAQMFQWASVLAERMASAKLKAAHPAPVEVKPEVLLVKKRKTQR